MGGPQVSPRVLIVMADQTDRALLRAALRAAGYDALGAGDPDEALAYPAAEAGRGPVRLVIVDQGAVQSDDFDVLTRMRQRFAEPATLFLASAVAPPSREPWDRVIQRPVSVADILRTARQLLPLPATAQPID